MNYFNTEIQIEERPYKATCFNSLDKISKPPIMFVFLACENIRYSSLFVAGEVSRGETSTTQRQKFHTDDVSPAAKSGEKLMFSQAIVILDKQTFLKIRFYPVLTKLISLEEPGSQFEPDNCSLDHNVVSYLSGKSSLA